MHLSPRKNLPSGEDQNAEPLSLNRRRVAIGLKQRGQKTLPIGLLYDDLGSALFEAITHLPEYGLSRAERALLELHARTLLNDLHRPLRVIELGSGSAAKTGALLRAACGQYPVTYYPIDISGEALKSCLRTLADIRAEIIPIMGDFVTGVKRALVDRTTLEAVTVLFLGNTIGNLEPKDQSSLLGELRKMLHEGDSLIIGTDLVKPVEILLSAYDDSLGVTAAFNLNVLLHLNRTHGADFDIRAFKHEARYDHKRRRIEMHLKAMCSQQVFIEKCKISIALAKGETIRTEVSYKYRIADLSRLGSQAGYAVSRQVIEPNWGFAVTKYVAS